MSCYYLTQNCQVSGVFKRYRSGSVSKKTPIDTLHEEDEETQKVSWKDGWEGEKGAGSTEKFTPLHNMRQIHKVVGALTTPRRVQDTGHFIWKHAEPKLPEFPQSGALSSAGVGALYFSRSKVRAAPSRRF